MPACVTCTSKASLSLTWLLPIVSSLFQLGGWRTHCATERVRSRERWAVEMIKKLMSGRTVPFYRHVYCPNNIFILIQILSLSLFALCYWTIDWLCVCVTGSVSHDYVKSCDMALFCTIWSDIMSHDSFSSKINPYIPPTRRIRDCGISEV